jgi:ABC-type nitrate/sulfonate/bicarbonate transport system substrate-binding protein
VPAGCGATGRGASAQAEASLLLDFKPSAVHAGIYLATARDYPSADGVDLDVAPPPSSAQAAITALTANRADFAVLDIHDLALAREQGKELVGVMAIVQRPLAAVVAAPGVSSPRALEGQRVGLGGSASDRAVLRSVVKGAGGDPARVRTTKVGFDAVAALTSGRVKAATAFWTSEGVQARRELPGAKVFRVDDFGAPAYPELVLTVTQSTFDERRNLVRAVVGALQRGYREALVDPEAAVGALLDAEEGLDRAQVARELDAVQPLFQAPDGTVGTLDVAKLQSWAQWEARFGITKRPPEVFQAFAPDDARESARKAAQTSGQ